MGQNAYHMHMCLGGTKDFVKVERMSKNCHLTLWNKLKQAKIVAKNGIACDETWMFQCDPEKEGSQCIGKHMGHQG